MFLPGEALFSAALSHDPLLIEHGIANRVVLASPTTLIALLKAVSYGWRQERLQANAQEISDLGRELYQRLLVLATHYDDVKRGLDRAVDAYNRSVASLETRVLVTARRFRDLGASSGDDIPEIETIEKTTRAVQAPEIRGLFEEDSQLQLQIAMTYHMNPTPTVPRQKPSVSSMMPRSRVEIEPVVEVERPEVAHVGAQRQRLATGEEPAADVAAPVVLRRLHVEHVVDRVDPGADEPGAKRGVRREAAASAAENDVAHQGDHLAVDVDRVVAEELARVAEVDLEAGLLSHEADGAAVDGGLVVGVAAEVDADEGREEAIRAGHGWSRQQRQGNEDGGHQSFHQVSPAGESDGRCFGEQRPGAPDVTLFGANVADRRAEGRIGRRAWCARETPRRTR